MQSPISWTHSRTRSTFTHLSRTWLIKRPGYWPSGCLPSEWPTCQDRLTMYFLLLLFQDSNLLAQFPSLFIFSLKNLTIKLQYVCMCVCTFVCIYIYGQCAHRNLSCNAHCTFLSHHFFYHKNRKKAIFSFGLHILHPDIIFVNIFNKRSQS